MTFEDREARQREAAEQGKRARRREREDVKAALALPETRRLLARFLADAGVDVSAYRETPTAMAFAGGWQDAGRWWLALIREHCPEREAQMRAEAKRDAREGDTDEENDD